ncbi:MAG TPA: TIGR02147 family protein [Bdellovibrio sp.]|nr:TIGR02147 family protein [Bdellovibrio sp.]
MSLFLHLDYRKYLSEHISKLPKKGYGELSRMAKAIGIHQTLMSLILTDQRDLSLEQAHDLAHYLGLSENESDYFLLLVQYSRAGNTRFKESVKQKIERMRQEAQQLSKRIEHEKVLTEKERALIYSTWIYSAIRLFTATKTHGVTPEEITQRFHLSRPEVMNYLETLEAAGLIENSKGRYVIGKQKTFLEFGSPHLQKHHSNWRIQALHQAHKMTKEELMYTCPMVIAYKDFPKLREKIAHFIKEFMRDVDISASEELACLNVDFFWLEK